MTSAAPVFRGNPRSAHRRKTPFDRQVKELEQNELSFSSLCYLETIYRLHGQTGIVRSVDLANALQVSRPSVTRAVKLLADGGLVYKNFCGEIILTSKGFADAQSSCARCDTLREFFHRTVGDTYGLSARQISRVSYLLNDQMMEAIRNYLGQADSVDCLAAGILCE